MTLQKGSHVFRDYWVLAHVLVPEVERVLVVAPSSDQAGVPGLGGGMRAPVTAGGDE